LRAPFDSGARERDVLVMKGRKIFDINVGTIIDLFKPIDKAIVRLFGKNSGYSDVSGGISLSTSAKLRL
jgi:hypothetical protein